MDKLKKKILIIGGSLLLLGVALIGFSYVKEYIELSNLTLTSTPLINQIESFEKLDENYVKYKEYIDSYQREKYLNASVVARLDFDSNLINETVVQGQSNNTYLRINYKDNSYDDAGSIFMDYRNTMDDQNLIIYGHTFLVNANGHDTMFTDLHKLEKQSNYSENKRIYLTIDNEVRVYDVAYVYLADIKKDKKGNYTAIKDGIYYYCPNFIKKQSNSYKKSTNIDDFDKFIDGIEGKKLYDTGIKLDFEDKFLTLQTCCSDESKRLIVVAKQEAVLTYSLPSYYDYLLKNDIL